MNRLVTSFLSVLLVLLWVPVSWEGFCFVLPTCDFPFSCSGGILRSTVSCEGRIHGQYYADFILTFKPL